MKAEISMAGVREKDGKEAKRKSGRDGERRALGWQGKRVAIQN
jgi:hypothetical protein